MFGSNIPGRIFAFYGINVLFKRDKRICSAAKPVQARYGVLFFRTEVPFFGTNHLELELIPPLNGSECGSGTNYLELELIWPLNGSAILE